MPLSLIDLFAWLRNGGLLTAEIKCKQLRCEEVYVNGKWGGKWPLKLLCLLRNFSEYLNPTQTGFELTPPVYEA